MKINLIMCISNILKDLCAIKQKVEIKDVFHNVSVVKKF